MSTSDRTNLSKDDNLEKLCEEVFQITREIRATDHQKKVLKDFSKNLETGDADMEKLEAYLNLYEIHDTKLNSKRAELRKKEKDIKSQVSAIYNAADREAVDRSSHCANVSVILQAAASGKVELSFTYVVTNATWTPLYDLRVSLFTEDKGQKSENTHLNLQYRASVYQSTGEDWKDVVLTLSTASPTQFVGIPTLKPARVSGAPSLKRFVPPRHPAVCEQQVHIDSRPARSDVSTTIYVQKGCRRRCDLSRSPSETERDLDCDLDFRSARVDPSVPVPPPQFFPSNNSYSQSSGGAISATFTIPGQITIASSKQNGQVSHKVVVADLHFGSVNLEWITVPIQSTDVFLRAKVINTSNYVLLPGTANIFLDGSFVASSTIPVSRMDQFNILTI